MRVVQIIDTVLVKLMAESEDTQELYSLLESSEDIVVEEVEETLIRTGQYNALLKLYQKRNDVGKLLDIMSKYDICVTDCESIADVITARLVDGEWTDDDIEDPLGRMMVLLNETRDRALVQQWGLWLVKRDTALGLKVCVLWFYSIRDTWLTYPPM